MSNTFWFVLKKGKKKQRLTYIAHPRAAYAASAALGVANRAGVLPRPQLKPAFTNLACSRTAVRSRSLLF